MEVINTQTGETKKLGAGHKVAMDHGRIGAVEPLSREDWEAGIAEVGIDETTNTVARIQKECSDLSGAWEQTSGNSGTLTWTVTGPQGGPYHAVEEGLGKAEGPAIYQGGKLKIDWKTGTWAGYYEWKLGPTCAGGEGTLTFTEGTRKDQTDTSDVVRRVSAGAITPR